jgi:hypothetical protein
VEIGALTPTNLGRGGQLKRKPMFKKKCHNCGIVDSIHITDEETSKLMLAFGPKDDDGLQMYFIYCRCCQFINIYKPGWFGNTKFNSLLNAREVYTAYQRGKMTLQEMGFIAGRIQRAMIEDGVLPQDWEVV